MFENNENKGIFIYVLTSTISVAISLLFSILMGLNEEVNFVGGVSVNHTYAPIVIVMTVCSSIAGVFILYRLLMRDNDVVLRFMIALIFTPTASLSVIILGITILGALYKKYSATSLGIVLGIITLIAIYAGLFTSIFIITDTLPDHIKNVIYVFYGSVLGFLLGYLMPTLIVIPLLITLSICDLLVLSIPSYRHHIISGLHSSEHALRRVSVTTSFVNIGLGDIILYAMIPSHILSRLPKIISWILLIMLVAGLLVNAYFLKKKQIIPGLIFTAFPIAIVFSIMISI